MILIYADLNDAQIVWKVIDENGEEDISGKWCLIGGLPEEQLYIQSKFKFQH